MKTNLLSTLELNDKMLIDNSFYITYVFLMTTATITFTSTSINIINQLERLSRFFSSQ